MLEESFRRDDLHRTRRGIRGARHAADAAIVIDVAVRIDHRENRLLGDMLGHELQRRARDFDRGQRIDDDPAGACIDERHGRDVEAAHLVDALGDLEEAVLGEDLRLTPQARIGRIGRLALEERVRRQIERRAAVGPLDERILARRDEAALRKFEIPAVVCRHNWRTSSMLLMGFLGL